MQKDECVVRVADLYESPECFVSRLGRGSFVEMLQIVCVRTSLCVCSHGS